jgi:hypothetical protein
MEEAIIERAFPTASAVGTIGAVGGVSAVPEVTKEEKRCKPFRRPNYLGLNAPDRRTTLEKL